ncbi:nitroreductase [Alphaproteobacteria bacterium]|nr:nitroreductase [Alphaproteobacteria bacterium]
MSVLAGKKSDEMLGYLLKRRSVKVDDMAEPGPDADQLKTILTAAVRVPDHGKMFPWTFTVFQGEAREEIGHVLREAYIKSNPEASEDQLVREAGRFVRAPLVIAVVFRVRKGKNPIWEQALSAGAVCQNLMLAANALGFGTQWLTEWYSYDEDVKAAMGLDKRDHVAGFVYIGSVGVEPEERDRPDLDEIVSTYGAVRKTGDQLYDREKFGFPSFGFNFIDIT